jgi:hypothetical protein
MELGISLVFMPAYRFGSHHLWEVSAAVDAFQRLGGSSVRQACNSPDGIMTLARESASPSPVKTHKMLRSNYFFASLPYVPGLIGITRSSTCDERRAAAFLEAVLWLTSKTPVIGHSGEVQIHEERADFFEKCARLVCGPRVRVGWSNSMFSVVG